jgi:hypothetical protein
MVTVAKATLSPCFISTEPFAFLASLPVSNSNVCAPISRLILKTVMLISPGGKIEVGIWT